MRASFIPQSKSPELEAHRPIAPSKPMQAMASRALLFQHVDRLEPKWLCAEGFKWNWCADAHILVAALAAEEASEWGEPV